MIAEGIGRLAVIMLVCWACAVACLLLAFLLWPLLRPKSHDGGPCYAGSMSSESMSFREWLFHPILARIECLLATTLAQLNTVIAANTAETALAVAAISANVAGDFTPQATQISANTAALAAVVPNTSTTPPPASPITATPALVALSPAAPAQSVALTEANGQPNVFNATSSNTAIATVSPASGPGPFTISRIGAGIGASVSFTDQQNNTLTVAVSAS